MSLNRPLLLLSVGLLGIAFAPADAWANEANKKVSPRSQRESVLEVADRLLAEPDLNLAAQLRERRSPFVLPEPVAAKPDPETEVAGPAIVAPVRLTNQQALALVAERLRPRGTIIQGATRIVMLEGGGRLSAGVELPLTVRGEDYKVVVDSVQSDHFVLRLGGQTLALPTNPGLPTGGATFDRPSPTPAPDAEPESPSP